jgi:hypothetical protein
MWERPCGVVIATWNRDFGRSSWEYHKEGAPFVEFEAALLSPSKAADFLRVLEPRWDDSDLGAETVESDVAH